MAGPSFDASQVAAFFVDTGTAVTADTYNRNALLFPQFCDVISPEATSAPLLGHKSTTLLGEADPLERSDGEPISASTMGQGYSPQGKIRIFSRSFAVPERQLRAAGFNPKNAVGSAFEAWAADFSRKSMITKDRLIAKALANGAKTAGDSSLYDGSYIGNDDPYPALGYDGVSWFNAAHPAKFTSTTYSNTLGASDLSATSLQTAYDRMRVTNAKDENDRQILLAPSRLIHPASLRQTVTETLQSELQVGTALNTVNAARGLLRPVENPFLDEFDTNGWFVQSDDLGIRAFDSGAPIFRSWFDNETEVMYTSATFYFGWYLFDWRPLVAANLATS